MGRLLVRCLWRRSRTHRYASRRNGVCHSTLRIPALSVSARAAAGATEIYTRLQRGQFSMEES